MSMPSPHSSPDGPPGQPIVLSRLPASIWALALVGPLGTALLECATEAQHGQASERAGAALGADLLQELLVLRGRPQAEAFRAVQGRLHALTYMGHADSAAAGYAGAIVNVLEVGIANLPKTEGQQQ